ncbi:uncharacterized protein LOC111864420 [Cryptotermes secundus]|uniref:uncharacterized protein LOC111864420 n=1 Tax=Cryptotermes secundus TaxID=105785 RepID=UPI001454D9DD|nr:uncharacterized protein LOC111864420 [Cryptotermes secundus]
MFQYDTDKEQTPGCRKGTISSRLVMVPHYVRENNISVKILNSHPSWPRLRGLQRVAYVPGAVYVRAYTWESLHQLSCFLQESAGSCADELRWQVQLYDECTSADVTRVSTRGGL